MTIPSAFIISFDRTSYARGLIHLRLTLRRDAWLRENKIEIIAACPSSVVELWFAVADFPKGAVGADVVTKAALLALLFDL